MPKRLLILLVLLFTNSIVFAQNKFSRSIRHSYYRTFKNADDSTTWTKWVKTQTKIGAKVLFDFENESITIYDSVKVKYDIIKQEVTKIDGKNILSYVCSYGVGKYNRIGVEFPLKKDGSEFIKMAIIFENYSIKYEVEYK